MVTIVQKVSNWAIQWAHCSGGSPGCSRKGCIGGTAMGGGGGASTTAVLGSSMASPSSFLIQASPAVRSCVSGEERRWGPDQLRTALFRTALTAFLLIHWGFPVWVRISQASPAVGSCVSGEERRWGPDQSRQLYSIHWHYHNITGNGDRKEFLFPPFWHFLILPEHHN